MHEIVNHFQYNVVCEMTSDWKNLIQKNSKHRKVTWEIRPLEYGKWGKFIITLFLSGKRCKFLMNHTKPIWWSLSKELLSVLFWYHRFHTGAQFQKHKYVECDYKSSKDSSKVNTELYSDFMNKQLYHICSYFSTMRDNTCGPYLNIKNVLWSMG